MLLLKFDIGGEHYVLDTHQVMEIVPKMPLKTLPMEENYIAGIFNYHGNNVPVVDINHLCVHKPAGNTLTTRIIIARLDSGKIVGILADSVTETLHVASDDFESCGITPLRAAFLGEVARHDGDTLQMVKIEQLLSEDLKQRLFSSRVDA